MKHLLLIIMLVYSYTLCRAQATTIVIDNQTPGWLSSKINYGDQQTVRNLTVTGYINSTDLSFIGYLMEKHNLSGCLNLADAEVVDVNFSDNSEDLFKLDYKATLNRFSIPKSIPIISPYLLSGIYTDTLDYGSERCTVLTEFLVNSTGQNGNKCPKVLILREGVTKIECFSYRGNSKRLESAVFPQTLDSIGDRAFKSCSNLVDINLPNSIHTIGTNAFAETSVCPDSLYLPTSLREYHTGSFPIKNGQVIVLGNEVNKFSNASKSLTKTTNVTYIINKVIPPIFYTTQAFMDLSGCTLYVPKEGYSMYADPEYDSLGGRYGSWTNPYSQAKIKTIHIPVEEVLINNTSTTLNVGSSIVLIANVVPSDADNTSIYWVSSRPNVASVNSSGLVTAISSGIADIFAYSSENSDIYATCQVTVHQPLESISLNSKNITLNADETYDGLSLTYYPATADNKNVIWETSDAEILTVDDTGKITAIKGGEAKVIVISVEDCNIKDTCTVTVLQPATGILLDKSTVEITEEGSIRLVASVIPDNASNKNINWESSDTSIAMVSGDGVVYGIKEGQATIMATTEDGGFSALCKVIVKKGFTPIAEISLNVNTIEGCEGESYQLVAMVLPENASNKELLWRSLNENIADVDNNGLIKFRNNGATIITVSATDGSGIVAECAVTVTDSTNLKNIISDSNAYITVYTLQGIKVYEGLYKGAHLIPGTYIVLCDGKSMKINK